MGEGEIAGQVRRSLERAREEGTTSSDLERLFQRASQTSRGIKNRTPLGRAGEPEEVARAVCFLSGPDAAFVTGAVLDVSGGWMMS